MNSIDLFEMILDMLKPEARNMLMDKISSAMEDLILMGEPLPEAKDMIDEVKSNFPDGNIWKDMDEVKDEHVDRKQVTLLVNEESPESMMMYVDGHVISLN